MNRILLKLVCGFFFALLLSGNVSGQTILSRIPTDGSSGFSREGTLVLNFDKVMALTPGNSSKTIQIVLTASPSTIVMQLSVKNSSYTVVAGSGSVFVSGTSVLIYHPCFDANTSYTVLIDAKTFVDASKVSQGNAAIGTGAWDFTTTTNYQVPTYLSLIPDLGAEGVDVAAIDLTMSFPQEINAGVGNVYLYKEDGTLVKSYSTTADEIIFSQNYFSIYDESIVLDYFTEYYVLVDNGFVQSVCGILDFAGISSNSEWRFRTIGQSPQVVSTIPENNGTDVELNSDLVITFNENVVAGTSAEFIRIFDEATSTEIQSYSATSAQVNIVGATVTINPNDFDYSTSYYVTIDPGFVHSAYTLADYEGNATPTFWRFTTKPTDVPIMTPDPIRSATNVSISNPIYLVYNQPIRNIGGAEITNSNVGAIIQAFTAAGNPVPFSVSISSDKTIITIVPNAFLAENTSHTIAVNPVESMLGLPQPSGEIFSFTTALYSKWIGSNTNWNSGGNWDPSKPGFNGYVRILGSATGIATSNGAETFNDLIIEAGGKMTNGGGLVINRMLAMNFGQGSNASFINTGTLSASPENVKIYQRITQANFNYFISSPVEGATISSTGGTNAFYWWNAPSAVWATASSSDVLTLGRGYITSGSAGGRITYTGNLNNSTTGFNAVRTTTPNNYGWNLAGNPFTCPIDWNSPGVTKTTLNNAFYVWQNDLFRYGTYNGNAALGVNVDQLAPSLIPAGHAFWVQVPIGSTTGTLSIDPTARTHGTSVYNKAATLLANPVIRVLGVNGEMTDETATTFIEGAASGFESFDSEKYFANTQLLEVFFAAASKQLAINSFPVFDGEETLALGYRAPASGTYSIKISSIENFSSNVKVLLEDTQLLTITDVSNLGEYSFSASKGTNSSRFKIHISGEVPTSTELQFSDEIKVVSNESGVYVVVPEGFGNCRFKLYDITGRVLADGELKEGMSNSVKVNVNGIGQLVIYTKGRMMTSKVILY